MVLMPLAGRVFYGLIESIFCGDGRRSKNYCMSTEPVGCESHGVTFGTECWRISKEVFIRDFMCRDMWDNQHLLRMLTRNAATNTQQPIAYDTAI